MIPVLNNAKEIVGRVNCNSNLDYWDGNNHTNGGTGLHKGLSRLRKSGDYVLIHSSQWQGSRDSAEVISKARAVKEILGADCEELFDTYPDLKVFMDEEIDSEE